MLTSGAPASRLEPGDLQYTAPPYAGLRVVRSNHTDIMRRLDETATEVIFLYPLAFAAVQ